MQGQRKIAVAGATGRVGRHVVGVLREQGHDVVPIARATGVDVVTGEGLAEALEGVDAIVDAATGASPDEAEATAFFTAATRNLQHAAARAGVRRIVVLSIVGTDRFGGGYGAAKVVHEQLMLAGPVPAVVLRATQFHEFVPQLLDWGRQGGVAYVPKMRTQLVGARAVAEQVAVLVGAASPPQMSEIAGPKEESLVAAATLFARRTGDPIRIEGVSDPAAAEAYESGALLPGPDAILAGPTFEEWLAATYPTAKVRAA